MDFSLSTFLKPSFKSPIRLFLIPFSLLFSLSAYCQNNAHLETIVTRQELAAEKLYNSFRYLEAINAYEDFIKTDPSNTRALKKLATSYRKLNDFVNAERVYINILKIEKLNPENYLYYAQSASVNKHYDKAVEAYARYAELRSSDSRGAAFIAAYGKLPDFYRDSSLTKIELLNINSGQSDFSPTYFKKGLVFCSNRNEGQIIKRVFEWNQSAFLDLYYVTDTANIKGSSEANDSIKSIQKKKYLMNDDDTYPTSNDSKTLGYMGYNYKDTSGMFSSSEIQVTRFSKTITTKYHEGPVSFFSSQDSLIFTRNNYNKGKYRESEDGINKLKLYSANCSRNDSNWKNIKSLPFNSDNYSTGHPAIAPGDSVLYFVSDMPGGFGGTDIYKSSFKNGEWSKPQNLGTPINTEGNEMFPFIDSEYNLYFSSDGHPGLGGLDMFKTTLLDSGVIQNLGYPANSSFDDFGIIADPKTLTGYFSSNRRRGVGDDDIYRIKWFNNPFMIQVLDSNTNELISLSSVNVQDIQTKEQPQINESKTGKFKASLSNGSVYSIAASADNYSPRTIEARADSRNPIITVKLNKLKPGCILAGTITDKETHKPIFGARIIIVDLTAKDTVYNFTVGNDGKYRFTSLQSGHNYSIDASSATYFNTPSVLLNTSDNKCLSSQEREYDYLRDFQLDQIILGKAIKIENIYFDLSKYNIRPSAAKELDKIVRLMQENPDIIIELSSHTDCRASYQYNMTLSDNRAKASAEYIISKGIPQNRITGKGYGETKLVNDCACEGKVISKPCTEEQHQANRRTEFQVTGFLSSKDLKILNEGKGETPTSVPVGK